MYYSKENNQYVTEGIPFTLNGVSYPAMWLYQATPSDKTSIGLVEVSVIGSAQDSKYYWVSTHLENGVLAYTNTPKNLDVVKSSCIAEINYTAYSMLLPSDWMVVRAIENGGALEDTWKDYRAAVRTVANLACASISACNTVDELVAFMSTIQWPNNSEDTTIPTQDAT